MSKMYDVVFTVTRPESVHEAFTVEANDKLGAQVKAYPMLADKTDLDGCKVTVQTRKHKD